MSKHRIHRSLCCSFPATGSVFWCQPPPPSAGGTSHVGACSSMIQPLLLHHSLPPAVAIHLGGAFSRCIPGCSLFHPGLWIWHLLICARLPYEPQGPWFKVIRTLLAWYGARHSSIHVGGIEESAFLFSIQTVLRLVMSYSLSWLLSTSSRCFDPSWLCACNYCVYST